jgi:hypothetical protein
LGRPAVATLAGAGEPVHTTWPDLGDVEHVDVTDSTPTTAVTAAVTAAQLRLRRKDRLQAGLAIAAGAWSVLALAVRIQELNGPTARADQPVAEPAHLAEHAARSLGLRGPTVVHLSPENPSATALMWAIDAVREGSLSAAIVADVIATRWGWAALSVALGTHVDPGTVAIDWFLEAPVQNDEPRERSGSALLGALRISRAVEGPARRFAVKVGAARIVFQLEDVTSAVRLVTE